MPRPDATWPEPRAGDAGHRLHAVLFDMDGLLVDSEPQWEAVIAVIVERLRTPQGRAWTPHDQDLVVGSALLASAGHMAAVAGTTVHPEAIVEEMVTAMEERVRREVVWRPGARELLAACAAEGVPTALVSSSYRPLLDAVCSHLDPVPFAVTVAGDEVSRGKPDPEPYLTACRLLGVDPSCCVVLEDSPTGATAGEAAGCLVVAVPNVVPVEPTPRRHVVASLADLDLATLRAMLDTAPPSALSTGAVAPSTT